MGVHLATTTTDIGNVILFRSCAMRRVIQPENAPTCLSVRLNSRKLQDKEVRVREEEYVEGFLRPLKMREWRLKRINGKSFCFQSYEFVSKSFGNKRRDRIKFWILRSLCSKSPFSPQRSTERSLATRKTFASL